MYSGKKRKKKQTNINVIIKRNYSLNQRKKNSPKLKLILFMSQALSGTINK